MPGMIRVPVLWSTGTTTVQVLIPYLSSFAIFIFFFLNQNAIQLLGHYSLALSSIQTTLQYDILNTTKSTIVLYHNSYHNII